MQALFLLDHLAVHLDRLGRASADLDQDRRLKVAALYIMLDAIAVFARSEPSGGPLTGIDPKTRALDVLVIDDVLAVPGRDVVAARVVSWLAWALPTPRSRFPALSA